MTNRNLDTLKKVANGIASAVGKAAAGGSRNAAQTGGASSGYTPINSYAARDVNRDAYDQEVKKQQQYINANPSAVRPQSADEKYAKYGGVIDSAVRTGYYTRDAAAARKAADKYGVAVTPTTYNGQSGWYQVDRAQRTAPPGSSGADESLLDDSDYAIVQKLKQDFADAQSAYNAASAAGNTAAAAAARKAMDNAHLEAERIRAGYSYSGGQDGSMYIDDSGNTPGGMNGGAGQTRLLQSAQRLSGGASGGWGAAAVPEGAGLTGRVEDYSSYLTQMHAARKEKALAELNAAYQSNLNALDRAERELGEQYQTARGNTAGASELSRRNFAEYAAASGLNSGTGGQAELARSVTLQNNLNTIDTAEADAISELQLQRANAETQYHNAIVQAEAEGDYQLASALYQEKVRVQTALLEMEIQEQKNALQRYQLQYQAQRDAISDQQWAAELARK